MRCPRARETNGARHGVGVAVARPGGPAGTLTQVVVAGLEVVGGVLGFDLIMRVQRVITVVSGVLTGVFMALVLLEVDWSAVTSAPAGTPAVLIGALVFVMTGYGLGWVDAAADHSRHLPRTAPTRGVVGWTTFGSAPAPALLLLGGLLLAGSSPELSAAIGADPIGALLPTWFLVPFVLVAVLGLVGGALLDIYSSGPALQAAGVRIPRAAAALVDGVLMVLGTVWVVVLAGGDPIVPFQGFLITLGVPVAAWAGIVLAWQGHLLGPLGLGGRAGSWAYANPGVLLALAVAFLGTPALRRPAVRAQEAVATPAGSLRR